MLYPTPLASLEGTGSDLAHKRFDLRTDSVRIGRGSTCEIVLSDPMVSREHAEIRCQAGSFVIIDLGSTHGTFVNGVRVQEALLPNGCRVQLGNSEFVFRPTQDAIPTSMVGSMGAAAPSSFPPAPAVQVSYPVPALPFPPPAVPPASAVASTGPPPARKRTGRKWLIGCGIVALLSLCGCVAVYLVAVLAESSSGLSQGIDQIRAGGGAAYTAEDLQLALAVPLPDERAQILEDLGRPDEFDISILQVEGGQIRLETWRYYGFGTRVDFVDGAIVWTVDLEPVPKDSVFPAWYDPTAFESGMTVDEASALAASASPAGTVPQRIDLSEGGEDMTGGEMLLGDQITLGFEDDGLVYVETLGATLGEGGG